MILATSDTDLVYNIVEELLLGAIDGTFINARAVSGGRAGSKLSNMVNPMLANNPYATRVKLQTTAPGGPLVMGKYKLKAHESKPNWIRLIPFAENEMFNRDSWTGHTRQ